MASIEEHRAIVTELEPQQGDWRFVKWRYSAFFKSDLHETMQRSGRDQIIICGVYAGIGILVTAIEAYTRDIETFVIADAIADFSPTSHFQSIEYAAKSCAVVLSTDRVQR